MNEFLRQKNANDNWKVSLVSEIILSEDQVSTSFHHISGPLDSDFLKDGKLITDGVRDFSVRNAVLNVFQLSDYSKDELSMSFVSQSQTDILVALKIGEVFYVELEDEYEEIFVMKRYCFPSGIRNSGYGEYTFLFSEEQVNGKMIIITSSYRGESKRTDSRLPFFIGLKLFGRKAKDRRFPVWRSLLGQAVLEKLQKKWSYCLLHLAFSLESYIDSKLHKYFRDQHINKKAIEHIIRVTDKRHKLLILNGTLLYGQTEKEVNKLSELLNNFIFTIRNKLAHGRALPQEVTFEVVAKAMNITTQFIWDWGNIEDRELLLTYSRGVDPSTLIDKRLLEACQRV